MKQWQCNVDGRDRGPLTEDAARTRTRGDRFQHADPVRAGENNNRIPAESIPGRLTPDANSPYGPMVPIRPKAGTGGNTPNAELKAQARAMLRGQGRLPAHLCLLQAAIVLLIGMIPVVGPVVVLIIHGPLLIGLAICFLTLSRGGKTTLGTMLLPLQDKSNFPKAFLVCFGVWFMTIAWGVSLIVPGVIAFLRYFQVCFIMADDPTLSVNDVLRKSREMMRGKTLKLFRLVLEMFCLCLLGSMTLGIGYIWILPYVAATFTKFYEDLLPPAPEPASTEAKTSPSHKWR